MTRKIKLLPVLMMLFIAGSLATSCKDKPKEDATVTTPTVEAPPPAPMSAPVVVAADDTLTQRVADATKDFPTVKTSINDGVITLTGEIERKNLKTLMMSLNEIRPKKIEKDQLVIK